MRKIVDIQFANGESLREVFSCVREYIHSVDGRICMDTGLKISGPYLKGNRVWIEVVIPDNYEGNEDIALRLRGMGRYLSKKGIPIENFKVGNRIFNYIEYEDEESSSIDRLQMNEQFSKLLMRNDTESLEKLVKIDQILNGLD